MCTDYVTVLRTTTQGRSMRDMTKSKALAKQKPSTTENDTPIGDQFNEAIDKLNEQCQESLAEIKSMFESAYEELGLSTDKT